VNEKREKRQFVQLLTSHATKTASIYKKKHYLFLAKKGSNFFWLYSFKKEGKGFASRRDFLP